LSSAASVAPAGGGVGFSPLRLPWSLLLMPFASLTNLSAASVASKAFTILVQSF
jgi:hypothetical protein